MPLTPTPYRYLSIWAIIALVLLRVTIGWHFYKEGAAKVREGGFSSVGFLGAAKGPLEDRFHAMLPDYDGQLRLDPEKMNAAIVSYVDRASSKLQFNDEQKAKAVKLAANLGEKLNGIYAQWSSQIREYQSGFERIEELKADPKRWDVESLSKQREEVVTKWRGLIKPVLAEIDQVTEALESQIGAIAASGESPKYSKVPFVPVGSGPVSVQLIDKVIPYFDMVVGVLLILGLCTHLAAWGAGLFLISVVLTQFPGAAGAQPTYYQAIEAVGCFVLAFTDAGRYAGLDYIPWAWWRNKAAARAQAAA
jgi:uncharacterized membrane protein YphA (DoxX/SURF4 family)